MTFEADVMNVIIRKQVELTAKGYTQQQASAAIRRSRRWAEAISAKVDTSIREQTFLDLFRNSLNEAEDWLSSIKQSMTTA